MFEREWRTLKDKSVAYVKGDTSLQVGLALILCGGLAWGGYYGYTSWRLQREEQAQVAFSDSFEAYQQALNFQFDTKKSAEDKKESWEQVENDFAHSFEQNAHSSFVPFFKAFQAQSTAGQQNRDEAVTLMRDALNKFNSSNPYRGLYRVSLALMLLDGDEKEVAEGLNLLGTVGSDNNSSGQEMALYYEGLYFKSRGEGEKALGAWQKLVALPEPKDISDRARSPWRQLAELKLSDLGQKKS